MSTRAASLAAAVMVAVALSASASPTRADEVAASAAVIELAEFTIGAPLGDENRRRISSLVAEGAAKDPASGLRLEQSMSGIVRSIRTLPDDAARAATRAAIVTRLHWDLRRAPDPVSQLILDRAGVVAASEATRAVVRRADIEGVCRSAAIGQSAAGHDFIEADCRSDLTVEIEHLPSLDPAGQDRMASGERRAIVLQQYWRALTPEARTEALAAAKRRAGSDDPLRVGRALETSALTARLGSRMEKYANAVADGLAKSVAAPRIGASARGF